ncbi:hypothetical protein D9M68_336620 [compost metagenome]
MISRRKTLIGLGSTLALPLVACAPRNPIETSLYADQQAADEWMSLWMQETQQPSRGGEEAPIGPLYVGRFADPVYFLRERIGWKPNPPQESAYKPVQVPCGFVTDFASIPRMFWSVLRPDGLYAYAAIIHDYLYWEQFLPRDTCDEVLRLCMQDFKIDAVTVSTIYTGVRAGGGSAWKENARLKAAGEKRILKRLPDDPTIRWSQWKVRPDVY